MYQDILPNLNPALAVLVLAFLAPVVTSVSGAIAPRLLEPVAIGSTALACASVIWSFSQPDARFDVVWSASIGIRWHLELDGLARMYALLATGIGLLVVIYATSYMPRHLHHQHRSEAELPRFFAFLLLFMAAMVGLVMAQDLILMFMFWDLTAIASFFLIGYDREEDAARSAALMALLVTGISAVLVLIGSLILVNETGTFQLPAIITIPSQSPEFALAATLIVIGALAKSAQVPLHFWLPRAMAAPTPVSAYLHSAAMVAAGVFLVGRFYPVISRFDLLLDGMVIVGLTSMMVGGLIALSKDGLKQILAYSTISQYGYVVFMLGIGGEKGVVAATLYVVAHALVKSSLFLSVGTVTDVTGATTLSGTGGLWHSYRVLAIASAAAAAGLVALPLTVGFFKDELYFAAAYDRGFPFAVVSVFGAVLTFTYIGRLWRGIFLGQSNQAGEIVPARMLWPIATLGVLTVLTGVWTRPIVAIAEQAASVSLFETVHIHVAYHLDSRPENLMAIATWIVGSALIASYRWWCAIVYALSGIGARVGPERGYHVTLLTLERISDAIHRFEVRDLRSRVATILVPTGILIGLAVIVTPNNDAFEIGEIERGDLPIITMLVATGFAAIAVAFPRDHLRLALTSSSVGFSLAMIYAFVGAPDVALVAVLIEVVLGIVILGLLLLMPSSILRFETRLAAVGKTSRRDLVFGAVAGIMAFVLVWGVLSRPSPTTYVIDKQAQLTETAHGNDIVTVILADFRGFDTLGEITVISLVLLGVLSLIRKGRLR